MIGRNKVVITALASAVTAMFVVHAGVQHTPAEMGPILVAAVKAPPKPRKTCQVITSKKHNPRTSDTTVCTRQRNCYTVCSGIPGR